MTRTTSSTKVALAAMAAAVLLAGCVTTPAPVVNHSFGPGEASAPAPVAATQPAANSGVQTFGIGSHANGTTSAAGYTVAPGDTLYSIAFAHGLDFKALAADNGIAPPYTIHPGQVLKLAAPAAPQVAGGGQSAGTTAVVQPAQPTEPVFGPVTTRPTPASNASVAVGAASGTPEAAPETMVEPQPTPASPVANAASAEAPPAAQPVVAATTTPPPGATREAAGITWRWPASGDLISGFQAGSGGDGAGIDIAGKSGDPVRAAASGTVVYSGNGLIGYGELIIIKHNDTYLSAYGHNSKRLVKEGQHVDAGQEIALMGASGAPRVELHFEIRKNGKPVDPMGFLPKK